MLVKKAQKHTSREEAAAAAMCHRPKTRLAAYLPFPRFLLKMETTQTAKMLYAL